MQEDILKPIVKAFPGLRILCISHDWLEVLNGYDGFCCHVGNWGRARERPSRLFEFHEAPTQLAIRDSLVLLHQTSGSRPFDIVIIDHDHRVDSIVEQYNLALKLSHSGTIFLFDDAVPSSAEMAGTSPTEGWWVGQVWMLTQLLERASDSGILGTANVWPTGVLVASGCGPIANSKVLNALNKWGSAPSIEEINGVFHHEDAPVLVGLVSQSLLKMINLSHLPLSRASLEDCISARDVVDEEVVREQLQPEFVLDTSERDLDIRHLNRVHERTPGKYVDRFDYVYAIGGANFYKDGLFLRRNIWDTENDLARFRSPGGGPPEVLGMSYFKESWWIERERFESAKFMEQNLLFGTPDEPMNWGMWLLYGISSSEYYVRNKNLFSGYFCCQESDWQRNFLTEMGVPPESIVTQDLHQYYLCQGLTMIRHTFRNLSVMESDRELFRKVSRDVGGRSSMGRSPKKLFISRLSHTQSIQGRRGLLNEEELARRLSDVGFIIVEPEQYSFRDQVAIFSAASAVVGLGGAAMFNTVFCQPGTRVVTIESSPTFIGAHANLFATIGLPHGLIIGKEDETDPRPNHKRWWVDVDAAFSAITKFIS
jgi:hypothetical protein